VLDGALNQAPESTEYTNIDNDSCLLALKTTGDASWHDPEQLMIWHCCLSQVGLKVLEI